MMNPLLEWLIFLSGIGQFGILVAAALVPFRLDWKEELGCLSKLHRQMYWVYGGYVVLSIVAFGLISVLNSKELASGTGLARGLCAYITVFWGIRLGLQWVFDVREHLTVWWLKIGYHLLTFLFLSFALIYGFTAIKGAP